MKAGEPSRTAAFMALYRALESSRADGERLFQDPFAEAFLPPSLSRLLRISRMPILGGLILRVLDLAAPGACSSGVARTRLIDDHLQSSLRGGIDQVVILGVGFDCRAYRIADIARCAVFEVDHPATFAVKRQRLAEILPVIPPHVRFVQIDFNEEKLDTAMQRSDYDQSRRTCFIWEGVSNYLSDAAVDAMFRWFAQAAVGSDVIFTYIDRLILTDPDRFAGGRRLLANVERMGEPWTFGLEPAVMRSYLGERGLELVDDLGAAEYRARYMAERQAGMRGYEFYRVARARVVRAVAR